MIDILETNMIWNRFDLQGASKEIREAITNHTAESELQAWTTVLPLVLKVGCSFLLCITVIQYNWFGWWDRNYIIYYITQLQLKTFFEFSRKLEDLVPKILNELCDKNLANSLQRNGTVGCEKASEQLEAHQVSKRSFHIAISYSDDRWWKCICNNYGTSIHFYLQAIVKQFAKLLDFVLKFDESKMMNPALQVSWWWNDMHYCWIFL